MCIRDRYLSFTYLNGLDTTYEPLNIMSFVIDLNWLTGPVLKYSNDKTKIDMINRVNKENFCLFPFFKNAERIAIIKSSLLDSVDIIFNTQIVQ